MALSIVGAGLGRIGTYWLKLALNALGFGPTYHMEEVILDMERKLPHWQGVIAGSEDWETMTIYKALVGAEKAPEPMRPWLNMTQTAITRAGFSLGLSKDDLRSAFVAHLDAVKDAISKVQLLVYQVKDG